VIGETFEVAGDRSDGCANDGFKTNSPRFIVPSPFATLAAKAGKYYSELEVDVKVE
jgi:hypothetical protein